MNDCDIKLKSRTSELRINCCYSYVCNELHIPLNGNQLGWNIGSKNSDDSAKTARSGKFNKHLKQKNVPKLDTLCDMEDQANGVTALFYSPFWRAIYYLETQAKEAPFESLDLNVLQCIYQPERDELGNLQRKALTKRDVIEIFKIGSLSAFGCLALLRNECDKKYCSVSKSTLDRLLRQSYVNICATDKIPALQWDIASSIQTWLSTNTRSQMKGFPANPEDLSKLINKKREMLALFVRKVKHVMTSKEKTLLANLASIANEQLVCRELKKINEHKQIPNLALMEEKGLHWVISKLNASNVRSERIQILRSSSVSIH